MLSRAGLLDRAAGALWGLAIGDALGMPTQSLSRAEIVSRYGDLRRFETAAPDHPLAAGLAAGTVTDDTAQAVLLARLLSDGARLDQHEWAKALSDWEDEMRASGSLDLLGPSTRAALDALRSGVAMSEAGRHGTTNGAAMRVAPVGVAVGSTDRDQLVDRVVEASMLTHNTSSALAGAAAVAAAVSAALDGANLAEAVDFAVETADVAADRGHWVAGASVARRIAWAVAGVRSLPPSDVPGFVSDLVGTSLLSQESVPAAFAMVVAHSGDPWETVCAAASIGGDCDTIAAMAGAVCGALHGKAALPADAVDTVGSVNSLDLDRLAERLLEIRCDSCS